MTLLHGLKQGVRVKLNCPLALLLALSQQEALHLHIPENLLATFFIVIQLTPFLYAAGVTLKKIRIENTPLKLGSITTSTPAFLHHGAVAGQLFQSNPGNPLPTNPKPLVN